MPREQEKFHEIPDRARRFQQIPEQETRSPRKHNGRRRALGFILLTGMILAGIDMYLSQKNTNKADQAPSILPSGPATSPARPQSLVPEPVNVQIDGGTPIFGQWLSNKQVRETVKNSKESVFTMQFLFLSPTVPPGKAVLIYVSDGTEVAFGDFNSDDDRKKYRESHEQVPILFENEAFSEKAIIVIKVLDRSRKNVLIVFATSEKSFNYGCWMIDNNKDSVQHAIQQLQSATNTQSIVPQIVPAPSNTGSSWETFGGQ